MTDDEVISLCVGRAFQNEGEGVGKVICSQPSSCQPSTDVVGRTAFDCLRQKVQRAQSDRFELGR